MLPTRAMNPGRLGAAAQWSSFPSSSGSQIVQDMPSACDSTNWAMFVRTSDRGEPAKINFCRLRTDAVENSPDSCSGGPSRDKTFAGGCIALAMNCPSWRYYIRPVEFWYQPDGKSDGDGSKFDDLLPLLRQVEVRLS